MRIIAGEMGGRILTCPSGEKTRPTTDRVRESLFAVLAPHLGSARVLDLFAGAGALGLEALSRGAASATFVDLYRPAIAAIHDNLDRLGLSERSRVVKSEALRFLALARDPAAPYDLILADPPYGRRLGGRLLGRLAEKAAFWLRPGGLAVIQTGTREDLDDAYGPLRRTLTRRYGETTLHFFQSGPEARRESSEGEG